MLLVINNLPSSTRYADVKALVKVQCGLTELIVDNLVSEGKTKKVTIGLADESDGALLMSKINGLYVAGQQLSVENVKQKKAQPTLNQYDQGQYNQYVSPSVSQFDNSMYYQQQNEKPQYFPSTVPMDSSQPQLSSSNFGIPYYMTNQNPIVGNTQQYSEQIQYPQVQGPTSSDPYGEQNNEMNRGHESWEGVRNRSRSRSSNRDPQREREREPRASTSRWNKPEHKRSDSWKRGSDKTSVRDRDRYNDDQSYNDSSYQDSYQGRSERNYGSNKRSNDRFEKNYKRSDLKWESSNRNEDSSFGQLSESFDTNDRRKVDTQRYHQDREPSRNSDDFSRGDNNFRQKRPYDAPDKNKFEPKNKKFGNNQQYNTKIYPDTSKSQYSIKQSDSPQHNKSNYYNKIGDQWPVQPKQSKQNNFKQYLNKGPAPAPKPSNLQKDFSVRWEGWLCQASSIIAQQILKNVQSGYSNKKHPVIVKLKACVRTRIDVVTGNDITMKLNDMLIKYREKFPESDDYFFYETVLQKVDPTEIEEFLAAQKAHLVAKEAALLERLKNEPTPVVPVAKQLIPLLGLIQKLNTPANTISETQKFSKFPSALPGAKQLIPAQLGPKPKPAQLGPKPKPAQLGPKPKPAQLGPKPKPAQLGPKPEPAQLGPKPKPAQLGPKPEPAQLGPKPESAQLGPKPTQLGPKPKPEPAQLGPKPEPAQLGPKPKPAQLGPKPEPAQLGPKPKPTQLGPKPVPAQLGSIQKSNIQIPAKSMLETQQLPKVPSANAKKGRNEDITNDSLYTLDDLREKILKEELDKIFDMCNEEIQNAEDDTEKSVGKFMSEVVLTNLRKVMSFLVKKRVLNIHNRLAVRIYGHPRCPKKPVLEAFLKGYGISSLRKSDTNKKLYVATFVSYEDYDALCKLGSTRIESSNVQFRPLLTIKPPKVNKKKKDNANKDENCEESDEMDGEGDEEMFDEKEEEYEKNNGHNKFSECSNENSDDVTEVEYLHNVSAETIIIEDDKGKADVAVDEVTTNKDDSIVDNEAAVEISDDNQNIEPETLAAIDFAADDLEDF